MSDKAGGLHRCAIYARISVTTEESVSIERQVESCRKYAEARNWEVTGEFIDDGVSATKNRPEERPGWSSLLAADGFDIVIIWKVDRLARRVLDFLNVDETLQARDAALVAVEDPIDMTTPQGRAFATMLAVFGEMEAAAISARVRAARDTILKTGRWPGGGVPYGYMSIDNPDGPGKVIRQNPERIGYVRQMAALARRGEDVNSITRAFTRANVPIPDSALKTRKTGDFTTWQRQTVQGILRNPILAGMIPHNPGRKQSGPYAGRSGVLLDGHDKPVVAEHLAIMSVEAWNELQNILDDVVSDNAHIEILANELRGMAA